MAKITLKGNEVNTCGAIPAVGAKAPDFLLTGVDLVDYNLTDFAGKKIVMNIFPSIDTDVCAASVREFNKVASSKKDVVVLCISDDLPFALSRFCGAEGLENVLALSEMRNRFFGKDYGLRITDGPLTGILSRAVLIIDEAFNVIYSQQVGEITDEPDYESALKFL